MAEVTVPREYIDNYVSALHDLDDFGRQALADALSRADLNNEKQVQAIMRVHCNTTGEAAHQLSREFYRGLSYLQTGQDMAKPVPYSYDPVATRVATRAILRDAQDEEDAMGQLQDRLSYETNRAAKVAMHRAGQVDGRDVRYARVPTGAETCAWCLMTAGLGFWYMTAEAASHSHAGCDCAIIPSIGRGDVRIDGYDSTVYRDMWREANRARATGNIPPEVAERIAREKAAKGPRYREDTNGTLAVMRNMYGLK